ncbi:MAG: zf-HC2 domain-containing protein [Lachnospiraceae bacterium]|nr:zf-HC2 domain-containing protein [Lachnospiraceae bacterium]
MNCKEYEKLIPEYLSHKMNYPVLKAFMEHTEHCENCKEELQIQFLVSAGMARLEEGDSFDLQRELAEGMTSVRKELHRHERFLKLGYVLEILVAMGIMAAVIWLLI